MVSTSRGAKHALRRLSNLVKALETPCNGGAKRSTGRRRPHESEDLCAMCNRDGYLLLLSKWRLEKCLGIHTYVDYICTCSLR